MWDGAISRTSTFVLQVDSDDKVGFQVADAGIVYLGGGRDGAWRLTWQCC